MTLNLVSPHHSFPRTGLAAFIHYICLPFGCFSFQEFHESWAQTPFLTVYCSHVLRWRRENILRRTV